MPEARGRTRGLSYVQQPGWVQAQVRAFSGYLNAHLQKRGLEIEDIGEDLRNGVLLLHALECLEGYKLPRWSPNPKNKYQSLENVERALVHLAQATKKTLVGINPPMIFEGNLKMTLGFVWQIILHFSIMSGMDSAKDSEAGGGGSSTFGKGPRAALLEWINQRLPEGEKVSNFTKDFSSGIAFCHLVNSIQPGSVDVDQERKAGHNVGTLQRAFDVAEQEMSIPQLLDAQLCASEPEEQSTMTYVSFFRTFASTNHTQPDSNVPTDWEEQLAKLRQKVADLENGHMEDQEEMEQLRKEKASLVSRGQSLTSEQQQLDEQIVQAQEDVKTANRHKDNAGKNFDKLKDMYRAQGEKAKEAIAQYQTRMKDMMEAGQKLQDKLKNLRNQNMSGNQAFAELQAELDEAHMRLTDQEQQNAALHQRLLNEKEAWEKEKAHLVSRLKEMAPRPTVTVSTQTDGKKPNEEPNDFLLKKEWGRRKECLKTKYGRPKGVVAWKFIDRDDELHIVILEHSELSGKRKISVDGAVILEEKKRFANKHKFTIVYTEVEVTVAKKDGAFQYDLKLDSLPFMVALKKAIADGESRFDFRNLHD